MRGSTTESTRTSSPIFSDSLEASFSFSAVDSSTAVVTRARTRPAASSARRSNSSRMSPASSTWLDSMSRRARLTASRSRSDSAAEISSMRRPAGMVGLVSTAASFGSDISPCSASSRPLHSSTRPSSDASSKAALAYRLPTAVATRNLLDRLIDQLLVPGHVKRLADDLLSGGDDEARDLVPHRSDRALAFGLDLFSSGFEGALRLLLGLLPELLPELLSRLVRGVDNALRGLARVRQLHLSFFKLRLRLGARPLSLLQLLGDGAL